MIDRLFRRRGSFARAADPQSLAVALRADISDRAAAPGDLARDMRSVFAATPAGPRVLARILARTRAGARSYVAGDPYETARREGMRDIGLWLMETLDAPDAARPETAEQEPTPAGARPGERR